MPTAYSEIQEHTTAGFPVQNPPGTSSASSGGTRRATTHAWYGADDTSVPLANPRALESRLRSLGRLGDDATVTVFADRGHDTDPYLVARDIAARLTEWAARPGKGQD